MAGLAEEGLQPFALINCAPQVMHLATNLNVHLVEVSASLAETTQVRGTLNKPGMANHQGEHTEMWRWIALSQ